MSLLTLALPSLKMCITNIYTDQYPDGKQLEFRTTDRCQDRENGQPCTQFIEENPIRKIQFGEPTTEYMLTTNTPLSQSPTPSPARGTNGLFNPPPGPGSYRGRGNYRGGVGGHFQNLHWNASGAPARAGRGQHAENVTLRHTSPQKLYSPEPVSHESTFQYSGTPHAEDSGSDGQSIPAADGRHGTRVRTREPIYPSQSSQQAGPLTLQPSSRLSVLEENEDWKSRSAGSELLEGETRYEQAQLFFSEAELPPDERIRQQNNEIRRQSAVPIVSNRSRWVGFDTEASRSSDESKGHDSSDEDDMPWLEDDEDEPAEDFTSFSRLAEQRAAMSSFNDRIDDALTEGLPAKASTLASTPAKLEIPLASGVLSSKDTSDGGPSNLSQGQKSSQQNLEENITLAEGEGAQLREWAGVVRSDRITIPERLLRDKDSTVKPRKRASRPKVKAGCHTCK